MKHAKCITLLTLGALIVSSSLFAQSDKDMKAIKAVVKQYENALNSQSLDDIVAVFDIDCVVLPDDAPAAIGHRGVREQYSGLTDASTSIDITLEIQELILTDEIAYVWSLNYGKITSDGGEEISIDSKSLMVLIMSMDGWKVHRYMFNGNSPAD